MDVKLPLKELTKENITKYLEIGKMAEIDKVNFEFYDGMSKVSFSVNIVTWPKEIKWPKTKAPKIAKKRTTEKKVLKKALNDFEKTQGAAGIPSDKIIFKVKKATIKGSIGIPPQMIKCDVCKSNRKCQNYIGMWICKKDWRNRKSHFKVWERLGAKG
jgi:hypothetical protein